MIPFLPVGQMNNPGWGKKQSLFYYLKQIGNAG